MFALYIDGKSAVIQSGSSFKLTRENPFVTDSGDYTLDVTLPLSVKENLLVFGSVGRLEVNKLPLVDDQYQFQMYADNIQLQGTAIVTEVTDSAVKLQLIGGRSDLKLKLQHDDGSDIYIDELDLGKPYETVFRAQLGWSVEYNMQNLIDLFLHKKDMYFNPDTYLYGRASQTECVSFPIYSSADGAFSNKRIINAFQSYGTSGALKEYWTWPLGQSNKNRPFEGKENMVPNDLVLAPQPYFCEIIERVLTALGYNVVQNDIRDSWMADIFIANARGALAYAHILPHWTVSEFITEIQQFFGIRILIDLTDARIRMKSAIDTEQDIIEISEVLDTFTMDIDADADQLDIATGNVDYDFPDIDKWIKLPDEVYERAEIKEFATYEEADRFTDSLTTEQFKQSHYIFKITSDKTTYAIMRGNNDVYQLLQVDMMTALYRREARDIDIKMRIVPVPIGHVSAEYRLFQEPQMNAGFFNFIKDFPLKYDTFVTSDTRALQGVEPYSVCEAVLGEVEESNKRDVIEVGFNQGNKMTVVKGNYEKSWSMPTAHGIPCIQDDYDRYYLTPPLHFMLAHEGEGIARDALNGSVRFDTRAKICISFIDQIDLVPDKIYLIAGKKYVCEKLEFSISEKGLDKIKKGYFYPIL